MRERAQELIVFPNEPALRRFQQEEALRFGWLDTSGYTTFTRLRKCCLPYARMKGRSVRGAGALLFRRQAADVARGHFVDGGPLGGLSDQALADVLEQLAAELALLPEDHGLIADWMLQRPPGHKLRQLGILYSVWRTGLQQEGLADAVDENAAVLRLLKGSRADWPPLLRDAKKITFRSVRWFNPYEESCVSALNLKMKVEVQSALPPAHAEAAADRLGQRIRAEIMDRPWAGWAEDLGDALAVSSTNLLQVEEAGRLAFSRSAGAYGEIEDLARRICWNLVSCGVEPRRIALVVPNIGAVQDIIPHVFSRFRIPYYFRRGRPVLSSPCVKTFLAWLAFPLRPERDALVDLLRSPAVRLEEREAKVAQYADAAPLVDPDALPGLRFRPSLSGLDALAVLEERIAVPEDHFNAEALNAVAEALQAFGGQRLPLHELIGLLERLLENATVPPRDSHEQGVWILKPDDAVGMEFDQVYFAGLNEGAFPGLPRQDALLSDTERYALRAWLEEQGRLLPQLALPQAAVQYEQESVLFLSTLGMARDRLVFSCQSVDQEGSEAGESEFFRKLWNLAGWCAGEEITLSPYDEWRMAQLGEGSLFSDHASRQRETPPGDRMPMPGESFLSIVPLPLCRAADEALQSAVSGAPAEAGTDPGGSGSEPSSLEHLVGMLAIESERDAYLQAPLNARRPSTYCGHIAQLKDRIAAWFEEREELSPTALESLAHCRYIFLLERVFGLRTERPAEDTPDPLDRGTLIHSILREIYEAIASDPGGAPVYAVPDEEGWRKSGTGGDGAVRLAVFLPGQAGRYESVAREVAERRIEQVCFGHPGVWAAEREKILEMVLNLVRYDAEKAASENRYPALYEQAFGGDSAVDLGAVRVRGKIDRIDLIFNADGGLEKIRVLDYKGSGRTRRRREDYMDEIRRNLDCQLPVYALAAQQLLLGENNTPRANALTEAGYLFYQRDFKSVQPALNKSLIAMEEAGLIDGFLATLRDNVQRLKNGDFAVDPLVAGYNDYRSVCRTEAVSPEDPA
jgi:hypothetical protein